MKIKRSDLFGIPLSTLGIDDLINFTIQEHDSCKIVNYLNAHGYNLILENNEFKSAFLEGDILFCDGFGIKIVAQILGVKIGPRMTPPDWIDILFSKGSNEKKSFYFIGDEKFVIKEFVDYVKHRHQTIDIIGYHHGFFLDNPEVEGELLADLKLKKPDVILVGMGMPRQEIWSVKAREHLDSGVFISVGALFRWYTGVDKRASKFMTDNGLEWLARLIYQPSKVWKRYIIGLPMFFIHVFKQFIKGYK